MRRSLLFAVFLACALSVSAVNFNVTLFPTERTIKLNESAIFEIELHHDSPVEEMFEVYSNDVTWDIRPEIPLKVGPQGSLKANLIVRPLNLNPGAYNLPINFKRTGASEQKRQVVYIELQSPFPDDVTYLPAVRGVATVDEKIDPRNDMTIKLSLENQNRRALDKVDVKVRSTVINKDYTTGLGPLEKKTLTFIAELDPHTPPQKDALQVSIIVPEQEKAYQFDLFPVPFEITEYGGIIANVSTESSFLKYVDTVMLTNEANKPLGHVYRVSAWFAKQWFIAATPKPVKEAGELTWDMPMEPGATAQIVVIYDYRPLFWLFLIAVVVVAAYFWFRSPIAVKKSATVVGSHEGGISELKVVIEMVNRGNKIARHVKVLDLVPKLADVVKEFKETILAPSKIVPHEQSGTLVRWDIDMMEPKEHRILMYKVRTRLEVLGGMTLPEAAVHFFIDGQEREAVSNKPEIRHKEHHD